MRLRELKGLGPKSEKQLAEIGIHTPEQLVEVGAIEAFQRLIQQAEDIGSNRPSLNFLYALVGALEDRH
ncbi:MAG: TfoX/Sxy family protein [Pseudomonadota bacterium]